MYCTIDNVWVVYACNPCKTKVKVYIVIDVIQIVCGNMPYAYTTP